MPRHPAKGPCCNQLHRQGRVPLRNLHPPMSLFLPGARTFFAPWGRSVPSCPWMRGISGLMLTGFMWLGAKSLVAFALLSRMYGSVLLAWCSWPVVSPVALYNAWRLPSWTALTNGLIRRRRPLCLPPPPQMLRLYLLLVARLNLSTRPPSCPSWFPALTPSG